MQKIKPCHHCRSEIAPQAVTHIGSWHVYCTCGARGPRSETETGAITLWNVRCKENDDELQLHPTTE